MIGRVFDHHIYLAIEFVLANSTIAAREMVIDTGYVGTLTLPTHAIQSFTLPFLRSLTASLADGSTIVVDVYLATIRWHDAVRDIEVICLEDRPLIGMLLLDGSTMNVHFKNGGLMELVDGA